MIDKELKDALTLYETIPASKMSNISAISVAGGATITFSGNLSVNFFAKGGSLIISVGSILDDKIIQLVKEYLMAPGLMPSTILSVDSEIDFNLLDGYQPEKYSREILPWYFGGLTYEAFQVRGRHDIRYSEDNQKYLMETSESRILLGNEHLRTYIHGVKEDVSKFLSPLLENLSACFIEASTPELSDEFHRKIILAIIEYTGGYYSPPPGIEAPIELNSGEIDCLLKAGGYQSYSFDSDWFHLA